MKKKNHVIICKIGLFVLSVSLPVFGDECPTSPMSIDPTVTVKVIYDKQNKLYTYDYTLANGSSSKLPIDSLTIKLSKKPFDSASPTPKWISSFDGGGEDLPASFSWLAASDEIKPGSKKSGFVLKSYLPPGPIRYFVIGKTGLRVGTPTAEDDEPIPDCPGFYDDAPGFDDHVSGIVDGPAPENQVAVDLRLVCADGEHDCGPISPYEVKGLLNVLLKTNRGTRVSDLDLTSLRFGVGRAPLASSKRIGHSENLILLRFNTEKVAIECGRDRVLFLSGKMIDGKELFGGAKVKTKNCDKRPKRKTPPHRPNPPKGF